MHIRHAALFTIAAAASFLMGTSGATADTLGKYYGLYAFDDYGTKVGEIDFTTTSYNQNRRIISDPKGDRQQIQNRFRDSLPGNKRPVYVSVTWYNNGTYCLPAKEVSVSSGPAGQNGVTYSSSGGCASGWHSLYESASEHRHSSDWVSWDFWQYFDPTAEAGKGLVKVCQDNPVWFPDDCSGPRILGSDF